MDSKYICEHLKKLTTILYSVDEANVFARVNDEGFYLFGTRTPLVRNKVCKRIAIYLIIENLQKVNKLFSKNKNK